MGDVIEFKPKIDRDWEEVDRTVRRNLDLVTEFVGDDSEEFRELMDWKYRHICRAIRVAVRIPSYQYEIKYEGLDCAQAFADFAEAEYKKHFREYAEIISWHCITEMSKIHHYLCSPVKFGEEP